MSEIAEVKVVETVDSLFRAHYGRLVRALTLACNDQEVAADAVQEAFVKAHLHWRRIQHYDDPVGWIRRVAINRLRDDHRRQNRKGLALERLASEPQVQSVEQHDFDSEVQAILAQLPKQQRIAIALFYVDELSIAEVAAALKVSEGAVKSYLHQGRARLRSVVA
ncbi:MAG TPA: sigma-70 family RNA polymerase sigma factor, partial [Ilumatobacteraceae bacterium]|nr:sigma-70 family RNA polymerase sigma factor [Ilumatobacteraceae bacterium]